MTDSSATSASVPARAGLADPSPAAPAADAEAAAAIARALSADDLERLATAAYLGGREAEALATWTRLHQACIDEGETSRGARAGFWLAFMLLLARGRARASGWLARTQRPAGGPAGPGAPHQIRRRDAARRDRGLRIFLGRGVFGVRRRAEPGRTGSNNRDLIGLRHLNAPNVPGPSRNDYTRNDYAFTLAIGALAFPIFAERGTTRDRSQGSTN